MPDLELAAGAASVFAVLTVMIAFTILFEHWFEVLRSMVTKRRHMESNPLMGRAATPDFSPQPQSGWHPLTTSLKLSPGQNDP